jgi:hypothetical protein
MLFTITNQCADLMDTAEAEENEVKQAAELLEANELAKAEHEADAHSLKRGEGALAEGSRERRRRQDEWRRKYRAARAAASEGNNGKGGRAGTMASREVRVKLRDAGLFEGTVDVMAATGYKAQGVRNDPELLCAACRVLAGLARGGLGSEEESERVLMDVGAGKALADTVRGHGEVREAEAEGDWASQIRVYARAASKHLGLGGRQKGVFYKDGEEGVDPVAALLKDRRFFDAKAMKRLAKAV